MTRAEELADEARRARKITHIVDITTAFIRQSAMSRREAEMLVDYARQEILRLFPDGEETYEVIYARRFRRIIDEFTRLSPDGPAVSQTRR